MPNCRHGGLEGSDNLEANGDTEDDEDEERGGGQTTVFRFVRGKAAAAAAAVLVVVVLCARARLVGGVALPRAAPARGRIARLAAAAPARLRGGRAEAPAGDVEPPSDNVEEESSCEWFKPHQGPGAPNPRLDTEHAPWLDAYRQVYFESRPKPNP